jgi:hypothetical protein
MHTPVAQTHWNEGAVMALSTIGVRTRWVLTVMYNTQNPWIYGLRGLSPRANCTDRATAACRQSKCQLLRIESVAWSAQRILTAVFTVF